MAENYTDRIQTDRLLKRVQELEQEVQRLKKERANTKDSNIRESSSGAGKAKRAFDFSAHGQRHVALKIAYLGWGYQGFASQENTNNTIEEKLFEALTKTRLVESRQTSNYHRCGRTDKGVSAFGQVISLDLRSHFPRHRDSEDFNIKDGVSSASKEIRYTHILNRVLPPDIRVLAWAPVDPSFSARFSCLERTYRYFFPRADLDIVTMNCAAHKYVGTHDFRNLCKMDVANGVIHFQRTILSAHVKLVGQSLAEDGWQEPFQLCQFEVTGQAFLYHQVRCMMAVLFLIGQGMEKPEIIDELLNVEKNPQKPQYSMAVEFPLVLYDCKFENIKWIYDREVQEFNVTHLQQQWANQAVKTHLLYSMLQGLDSVAVPCGTGTEVEGVIEWRRVKPPVIKHTSAFVEGVKMRTYKPLMDRPKCQGLESRIQHCVRRGRIEYPRLFNETETKAKRECNDTLEEENTVLEKPTKRVCVDAEIKSVI
ncbi:tRNA pseudouridine(38/39) synthase isoform X1 [Sturnira hondurensis]|uniref:tRNA pseudouridine(38/39) synthase isoform X1 n=1 Tax=Sturnira hondurensis TaxID=192404 RepID=UPI00187A4801|nr:tRNA pseudouridine(38/39) synthase isoform X1 [Sturnira hondurensis]XP_036894054.1 tRNA pseudouridine(38/39) synthase isoform X1 [Sturnira hondurensis]XP_036894055.1 tRNA pseudouridine(38/39) synthase isoform X1 [Sturnira hondurensis]XP_036894056.1 tRNA pseudouridine(38/39) synthase isoform X1 [Sturnira hondurensis]XP_036894057.1 tRNA pseudouridine(38/39) synthase isoform X1 [Sturnira hondurensis]XP_036894058.1 tRNA pseudouridine(38/39) synthase isoform X1 [Sturnira hondurensis]XP_03689405